MLEFGGENNEVNLYSRLAPFIVSINDNPDNELRIVIALPVSINGCKPDYSNPEINNILSDAVMVAADTDRMYEIKFETYIIYQCRNESYTYYDSNEIIKGKYLVVFEQSALLDYYKNVIFDRDVYFDTSNRKHYGIVTENHIIDIISNDTPIITPLN